MKSCFNKHFQMSYNTKHNLFFRKYRPEIEKGTHNLNHDKTYFIFLSIRKFKREPETTKYFPFYSKLRNKNINFFYENIFQGEKIKNTRTYKSQAHKKRRFPLQGTPI